MGRQKKQTDELLQGIKEIMEGKVFLDRYLDAFIHCVCMELAFCRENSLEIETEEFLESKGKYKFLPYLKFDENSFEGFQPLIGIFPWFKYVAVELSKKIVYITPTPEDIRSLLDRQNDEGRPFFLCDDESLWWERLGEDDELSESFGGSPEAPQEHDGGRA